MIKMFSEEEENEIMAILKDDKVTFNDVNDWLRRIDECYDELGKFRTKVIGILGTKKS